MIAERLLGLGAENVEWRAWRDEETGWMIGLDFTSHDVGHAAVWSFEHRKGVLAPVSPDAVSLSKQGEVGDRLIPKLRAVEASDPRERFDSGAFNPEALIGDLGDDSNSESPAEASNGPGNGEPTDSIQSPTDTAPVPDPVAEFARRREIDHRAIKTTDTELPDLGQTADLLDALRKRRGERESAVPQERFPVVPFPGDGATARLLGEAQPEPPVPEAITMPDTAEIPGADLPASPERTRRGKGRASIPSWDDILFGTRSDEDPS